MQRKPKVAVIGAGLAGLTAAYRLQQAGIHVDLYEARDRVGGRVLSVKINDQIAELGGQSILDGGEASCIRSLITELGLTLKSSRSSLNYFYFHSQKLICAKDLTANKHFDSETLKSRLSEVAKTARSMQDVLDVLLDRNDPLYKAISARLAGYEGGSVEKLSPLYIETLFHMLLGGISSVHPKNGEEEQNHVDLITIEGGNALLPQKMAEKLESKLHLHHPLKRVIRSENGSFELHFEGGKTAACDVLVLAIPCCTYEKIVFEKDTISADRLEAIQKVEYGMNAKILVPFDHVPSQTGGVVSDDILCFFDTASKILIIYYLKEASFFSKESIDSSYIRARPMIESCFGEDSPNFSSSEMAQDKHFVQYHTPVGYSWPNDPYAKGSYSYIASGQEELLTAIIEESQEKFKKLFAPENNIYFTGEHASILMDVPGTMEAACESGERIARAITLNWRA